MDKTKHLKTIVITRFPYESSWGGEEAHTLAISNYLREQGFQVVFIGSCPILLQKFQEQGFITKKAWAGKMIVTPFELVKSFLLFPLIWWNLRRHFRRLQKRYDIIALYCLSLNEKLFLTSYAKKNHIPCTWVEHQEIRDWLLKSPWKYLYRRNAKLVKISPISKKNEDVLLRHLHISPQNIQFILNGVNVQEIQQKKRKTQKGLIVYANRFIPKKGAMDFLKALQHIKKRLMKAHIILIGEGQEEPMIRSFVKKNLPSLHIEIQNFLKKENWFDVLKKADMYVSCARDENETFSLSTAEALSSGAITVVTLCSGISHFLENEKNAFICSPKDPKDLAEKIMTALHAPEKIREMAEKVGREKFDQLQMLKQYYSLILREWTP